MQSNSNGTSQPVQKANPQDLLMSPIATLIASEPSATTTTLHPRRINKVSIILAVIGLSSASKHVTARSLGSGCLLKSTESIDEAGVPVSGMLPLAHVSEPEFSPVLEMEAVRNRLGMVLRRSTPSMWLSLNRSTAPNSEGFRECATPGVGGGRLVRDGEDAMDDVDVAGEGGPCKGLPSIEVTTLGGFFIR